MSDQTNQIPPPNYDEAAIPAYTLPELLRSSSGQSINDVATWEQKRRPELLELFSKHVYGYVPDEPFKLLHRLHEYDAEAINGKAVRKQIQLTVERDDLYHSFDLLIYQPKHSSGKIPVFLGLNFEGNHTVYNDENIAIPSGWLRDEGAGRGDQASRWEIEEVIGRGYAVATIYYGNIAPDDPKQFRNGVLSLFPEHRGNDDWQAIGAWAWGLSRALDYIELDEDLDAERVIVHGHSRLGKAALWAGALDERFAAVISNNSGCGGAALSRRIFGETVTAINLRFPHWFSRTFHHYNGRENELPIDQHMLLALIAPRPLYVASASEDLWADPRGEFLSAKYASQIYDLYGFDSLSNDEMPEAEKPLLKRVSYHLRTGPHDITLYDWQRYLDFADHFVRSQN